MICHQKPKSIPIPMSGAPAPLPGGPPSPLYSGTFDPSIQCKISLRSAHGRFVSCNTNGQVTCDKQEGKDWEIFTCIPKTAGRAFTGRVALQSVHGTFLGTDSNGNVVCNKSETLRPEIHAVEQHGLGFGLRSYRHKYLSAMTDHTLQWNMDSMNEFEKFTIIVHDDAVCTV